MERIQNAIAKARATRDGSDTGTVTRSRVAKKPDADEDLIRAAWSEIPKQELRPRRLRATRITAFESGPDTADFDRLRTRMLQRMQAENWKKVAIVSPTAQNGKSTVSANLALSCGRQSHLRTMLIEMDLRRPGMSPILGLPQGLDVSRVFAGEDELPRQAVRLRDNLSVAPSLRMPSGSAEFLQAPGTVTALNEMARIYAPDVMLFDMPPMGASDDVIGFLANVDCALIVAAAGTTTIAEIDTCEREVSERTEVLGVVLNKCRFEPNSEGYGSYY